MAKRKKQEESPWSGEWCAWAGCHQPANFKAPKFRDSERSYQWFCEAHIAQFNKNWDYFAGMSEAEIYAFQKEAHLGGTRPTWKMGDPASELDAKMREVYGRMFGASSGKTAPAEMPIHYKVKEALALLDLVHPADKKTIKRQYRELVKKYHPDVNGGNRKAEETFKKITLAYQHLMEHYVET
jgi:hypothetical protein